MTNKDNGQAVRDAFEMASDFDGFVGHARQKSIRDEFAMAAIQGIIAGYGYLRSEVDAIAESAYDCADAMLKAREL